MSVAKLLSDQTLRLLADSKSTGLKMARVDASGDVRLSVRHRFVAAEALVNVIIDFLERIPVYHAAFKQHLR